MVGLPAAGKTLWVEKYLKKNPEKKYYVLGTNFLIDKMKVNGLPRKRNYAGRWEVLIERCTKCLNKMLAMSYNRRRNFIIDQVREVRHWWGGEGSGLEPCSISIMSRTHDIVTVLGSQRHITEATGC